MKNVLFLFLLLFLPQVLLGDELHTIEVEFSFKTPDYLDKQLSGYRLNKGVEQICETEDPDATKIVCEFMTENGRFYFSLLAYYSDGTTSPPSPTFPFRIGPEPEVPVIQPIFLLLDMF